MLARKHYAQRNNNIVNNIRSSTSSYTRLGRLKNSCVNNTGKFKRVPNIPQSEYIYEKRVQQYICNGNTNDEPEPKSCSNNKKYCDITKDLYTETQGVYIETKLPGKCVLNEDKKPMIKNVC